MLSSLFGRSKAPLDSGTGLAEHAQQMQLRTPSPTASLSAGTAPPQSPEVAPLDVKRGMKRSRSLSPKLKVPAASTIDMLSEAAPSAPASPAELLACVKKIPAKTLHEYVIARLPHAPIEVSEVLMAFFAQLEPPPKLHCVRCHKDYVEVENTDRSCLVPHDDESAEVEYVGSSKNKGNLVGSTYQTLWGCCNKVVEGDGDQGPPDGWCFEGFHTTDIKRARFRADSTIHDDKLVSCKRMRCFGGGSSIAGSDRGRSQRAAARKSLREPSDEEEAYDEQELRREAQALADKMSDADETASAVTKKLAVKNRKHKGEAMDVEDETKGELAVDANLTTLSATKSRPKSKTQSMKPKSAERQKTDVPTALGEPSHTSVGGDDVEMSAPGSEVKEKTKKPRKPRKSAADGGKYIPPKNQNESSDFGEDEDKPKRKKPRRKSTVSAGAAMA